MIPKNPILKDGYNFYDTIEKGLTSSVHIYKLDATKDQLDIMYQSANLPGRTVSMRNSTYENNIFSSLGDYASPTIKGGVNISSSSFSSIYRDPLVGTYPPRYDFYSFPNPNGKYFLNISPDRSSSSQIKDGFYKRNEQHIDALPKFCIKPDGSASINWMPTVYAEDFIKNCDIIISGTNPLVYEGKSVFNITAYNYPVDETGTIIYKSHLTDSGQRFTFSRDGLLKYEESYNLSRTYHPKTMIGYRKDYNDIILVLVEHGFVTSEMCANIMVDLGCEYAMSFGSGLSNVYASSLPVHKNILFARGKYANGTSSKGRYDGKMSTHGFNTIDNLETLIVVKSR